MQNVHPYFVHFPIGLILVGLLLDLLSVIFKKDSLRNTGWWVQLFGVIALVATVITGLIAESTVAHSNASHEIMETHKALMLTVVGVFTLLFIWRIILKTNLPVQLLPLLVYFILGGSAAGTLLYSAHLGGRLVYEFGVGGSVVVQPEEAGHHHHNEKTEDEAEHHQEAESEKSINKMTSPSDTLSKKQEKVHVHKGDKEHTH